MIILLTLALMAQPRPVIRLEDGLIKGDIRKPSLVEVRGDGDLTKTIEIAALKNLIQLEKRLLKRPDTVRSGESARD